MLRRAFLFCCFVAAVGSDVRAQILYGSIVGNVTDPSDAPLPGAVVSVTSKETGQSRSTITNEAGGYTLPTLPTGIYDLKVVRDGFVAVAQSAIAVRINDIARIDVRMQIGTVAQTIEVSAQTPALQTDRSEVRAEVTSQT